MQLLSPKFTKEIKAALQTIFTLCGQYYKIQQCGSCGEWMSTGVKGRRMSGRAKDDVDQAEERGDRWEEHRDRQGSMEDEGAAEKQGGGGQRDREEEHDSKEEKQKNTGTDGGIAV